MWIVTMPSAGAGAFDLNHSGENFMRMRKKKWAEPELNGCAFYVADPCAVRGRWAEAFPEEKPLHVELGCGKGVSTAQMAFEQKDVNFIAVDLISDVLGVTKRNIDRRYGDRPADNIRLCIQDVTRISRIFAPEDQVERIYISFPNPWTQRHRQHKRRLTHPRQLMQYRDFLKEKGQIWFKTDNDALFDDSVTYFMRCGFHLLYLTRDLARSGFEPNYPSEHEIMYASQGVKIKFLIAEKAILPVRPAFEAEPPRLGEKSAPEMTTLCYIEKDGAYLMLHRVKRTDDPNAGKWLGVGGHFEHGESPEECLIREVREETGLTLTSFTHRGVITFCYDDNPTEYMHLFTADGFEGEPGDCDEGVLKWVEKDRIDALPMWEGDRVFFRLLNEGYGPFFSLKLVYRGGRLARAILNGQDLPLDRPETWTNGTR